MQNFARDCKTVDKSAKSESLKIPFPLSLSLYIDLLKQAKALPKRSIFRTGERNNSKQQGQLLSLHLIVHAYMTCSIPNKQTYVTINAQSHSTLNSL